jgi:xanthosine utilization system XapX-like protein
MTGRMFIIGLLAIFGSLGLHLLFVQASAILFNLNIIFGKVLAICGLNGIYVTEKPIILWVIYPVFITILIIAGAAFTWIVKEIVEDMFFRPQAEDGDNDLLDKQG